MGAQKKVPKKQNVRLLKFTCLFPTLQQQMWKVFTLLLTKLRNALAPNSLDTLMQYILMESHLYYLDWGEIADLDKILKKPHNAELS